MNEIQDFALNFLIIGFFLGILSTIIFRVVYTAINTFNPNLYEKDEEQDSHLETLSKAGIKAHLYLPGVDFIDKPEIRNSLDSLKRRGFIFTKEDGILIGRITTANETAEEIAKKRRTEFKVVPTKE